MFLKSSALGNAFKLKPGEQKLGRNTNADIRIQDNKVSGDHLYLQVDPEARRLRIKDEKSRNNTIVNGREIRGQGWVEICPDDRIQICIYDFRLAYTDADEQGPTSCIITPNCDDGYVADPESKSIPLTSQQLQATQQFLQLRALVEITNTLRDVIQTEDVLERAVAMLFRIFPEVERTAICFVDKDARELTPKYFKVREGNSDSEIRISSSIGWHVVETQQALITNDAHLDFQGVVSVQELPMRSVMSCPLLDANGEVFGLIHADASKRDKFTSMDLEVLAAVALQIGLAINCARLHAIAIQDEQLRLDVERARSVQEKYLPGEPPSIPRYGVAGFYRPAMHVGGDYFDYIALPDNKYAIVMGDVVGHGVPAALTMVRLATETRTGLELTNSPAELSTRLSTKFKDEFITYIAMVLDAATDEITICNAGHQPPWLRRCDGKIEVVGAEASGLPLGVMDEQKYDEYTIRLRPGESLVLCTDGFPDALHEPSGDRLGCDEIIHQYKGCRGDAQQVINELVALADRFTAGTEQFDDMCMVCLKRCD